MSTRHVGSLPSKSKEEKKETKELEGQCRRSSCATAHKYFR